MSYSGSITQTLIVSGRNGKTHFLNSVTTMMEKTSTVAPFHWMMKSGSVVSRISCPTAGMIKCCGLGTWKISGSGVTLIHRA
jgi:hypothetical protein